MENSLKIFLIYNGTTEILSSRIIEELMLNGEKKENIFIFVTENYKLSVLKNFKLINNHDKKENCLNQKIDKRNFIKKFKNFFYFIHRKNKLLSTLYLRLGTFPIGLEKISNINNALKKDFNLLHKKDLEIYTPNVRVHNFQYLIFLSKSFKYHLIEEGKISFKDMYCWGPFSEMNNFFENLLDLNILIIFKLIISLKMFRDILKILLRGKSYSPKILKKYLSSPIFGLNWMYLKNIKPYSINKISKNAFLNFKFEKLTLYEKKSNYEVNLIKNLEKNYSLYDFKYYILALSGTTLEILKKEFDANRLNNINKEFLLIRPHPALNNNKIKEIIRLINLNLNGENLKLSEELRSYPLDIISGLKNFEIIYSNSKRSSVSIYF